MSKEEKGVINSPPPIPCAHCGINFMRRDLALDAPKICNSCIQKEKKRKTKGTVKMDEMKITIGCSQEEHAKIEEICINQGINYTDYFMNLHKLNTQEEWKVKELPQEEEKEEPEQKFENPYHEPPKEPAKKSRKVKNEK